MEGYSYFYGNELAGNAPGWEQGSMKTTTIFLGTDKVEEVVLKSKLGEKLDEAPATTVLRGRGHATRLHSPYPDPVGTVTELYALDTEKKHLSLVSQKSGLVEVTHAFVGKCE